jgi:hypothetical protein
VGAQTSASLAGLHANTVYRVRVVALNAAGERSRPSPEAQIITIDNSAFEPLAPANAARHFAVDVTAGEGPDAGVLLALNGDGGNALTDAAVAAARADVVVGDTVLFTEDVFVDSSPPADPYHPAPAKEVPEANPRAKYLCSRTLAATVIGDNASRMVAGTGSSAAGAVAPLPPSALPSTTLSDALAQRVVTLQVEWCTVSTSRASAYQLPHGLIVKRRHADLARLDVYRCVWEDEAGRWTLAEELRASYDK